MPVASLLRGKYMVLRNKPWFNILCGSILFILGLMCGWFICVFEHKPVVISPVHSSDTGYVFINPTLYSEVPQELSFPKYTPLKGALNSYVSSAKQATKVSAISIYYRDLNSSNWVGINETQELDSASMMKVATLIALLHTIEMQPNAAMVKITLPASVALPNQGTQDYYPPSDPVTSGNTYTVPDLMQRLIVQSDNGADALLINFIGDKPLAAIYTDLHLPAPGTSSGISTQNYSHLFRVLYNATYLNSADSEKALQLLSQTNFTAGLVAGVPSGTTVSHKFGESMDGSPGLDDCGIVYYPGHPYFLCVMTKGADFSTLAGVIKDISAITWKQVGLLAANSSQ